MNALNLNITGSSDVLSYDSHRTMNDKLNVHELLEHAKLMLKYSLVDRFMTNSHTGKRVSPAYIPPRFEVIRSQDIELCGCCLSTVTLENWKTSAGYNVSRRLCFCGCVVELL